MVIAAPATVLVVVLCDDARFRAATTHTLASRGARVLHASTQAEALRLVVRHADAVDLVVAELSAGGLGLARRLRAAEPAAASVAVVLASADEVTDAELEAAAELGVADVLRAPIAPTVLFAKARAAAENARVMRDLRQQLRSAELHARVDALTGLGNRRALESRLAEESAHARRHRDTFAVAMIDLDHFKEVNDSFGHEQGDALLADFGAAVQRVLRAGDIAFRYGGEEFVLLLRACDARRAADVTERLRAALRRQGFGVTFSAGVTAALSEEGYAADELVARADAALYRAKREGRDRTVTWQSAEAAVSAHDDASSADRDELVRVLKQARQLVSAPDRWLARGYAQDAQGRWRPVGSDDASQFSLVGALVRVSGGSRAVLEQARASFHEHAPELAARVLEGGRGDDAVTHDDVIALLDATIDGVAPHVRRRPLRSGFHALRPAPKRRAG